jgi:hypothetical protein
MFFKFPLLVPHEILAYLFDLLLRRFAGNIILFGQSFGRLQLLLKGSDPFVLGHEIFLKALSLPLMLKPRARSIACCRKVENKR